MLGKNNELVKFVERNAREKLWECGGVRGGCGNSPKTGLELKPKILVNLSFEADF